MHATHCQLQRIREDLRDWALYHTKPLELEDELQQQIRVDNGAVTAETFVRLEVSDAEPGESVDWKIRLFSAAEVGLCVHMYLVNF